MDIILIAGLWLDSSAWADVTPELELLGHRVNALTLPGQGDGDISADLSGQIAAVLAAVDKAAEKPMVVGHSAACTLAWIAADQRPEKVGRTVLIGGFPSTDGELYADFFEPIDGLVPFPGWDHFEGPDSADIDNDTKERFVANAIPVPEAVTKGTVELSNDRRFSVPVSVICPEFTPESAKGWIDSGEVPELANATRVELIDLDSGHWPMFTKPTVLARLLAQIAESAS